MEANKKGHTLIIDSGLLRPTYEIELDEISSWEFIVEENGATYFAFNLKKGFTQHISVPKIDPEKLYKLISCIEVIVGFKPSLKISERLLIIEQLCLVEDVTISLLGLYLFLKGYFL